MTAPFSTRPTAPTAPAPTAGERRRAPRFSLLSLATVFGEGGQARPCTVQDVSSGGALLTGAVSLLIGEAVCVVLPLRDTHAIKMVGRVVRRRAPQARGGPAGAAHAGALAAAEDERVCSYGVMFVGASLEAAGRALRAVDAAQLAPPRHTPRTPVLVLDVSADACAPTVAVLAAAGVPAVAVTNAFDALGWLLGEADFCACVVNPRPKETEGAELLRYLADEHPTLRRVAIHAGGAAVPQLPAEVVLPGPLEAAHVQRVVHPR